MDDEFYSEACWWRIVVFGALTSKVRGEDLVTLMVSWYYPSPTRIVALPVSGLLGLVDKFNRKTDMS